jgi:Zn-dependent M28 family amino/carboxypeptidase
MFIAFGAEEVGLVGSYYYVKRPTIDLANIKFLLNFDIVGTGDDGITVVNGSVFRKEFDKLKAINQKHKLLPKVNIRGKAPISDHYFFTQDGVPCFYIYTLGGIQAYHDIFDVHETLPLTKFESFFKLITTFADSF